MRFRCPLTVAAAVGWATLLAVASIAPACSCGESCACGPNCSCAAPPPAPDPPTLRVRKNQNSLTAQEKADFVAAVLTLKATIRPGSTLSIYDDLVRLHGESFDSHQAHGGPAFLPWHRQFLLVFERELQNVNPNVTVPYWDFAIDQSPTAGPWTSDFLGGDGDPNNNFAVMDGPFRQGQWQPVFDGPDLRRQFGFFVPTLPKPDDVAAALGIPSYDAFPWDEGSPISESFRNFLEGFNHPTLAPELHNRVHAWIGGSSAIAFSPNDPIFWLLHANVDRIWAQWQEAVGGQYLPATGGPQGHNLNDPMTPFGVTPAEMLNQFALGYRYDTQPLLAIPEPASALLLGLGGLGLLLKRQTRFRYMLGFLES